MAYRRTKPEIAGFQAYRKAYRKAYQMPYIQRTIRTSMIPHKSRKSKHKPKGSHLLFQGFYQFFVSFSLRLFFLRSSTIFTNHSTIAGS